MAKTSHQPSSRKRKRTQDDAVAARPLRRSRRVAYREISRLNDLPPELRNVIYSMVLRSETSLELTGNLSPTAKALSQVSRAVRIESLGVYFSENDFHAYLSSWWDNGYRDVYYTSGVPETEDWMALFGELATPRLRSIQLRIGCHFLFRDHAVGFIDFGNSLATLTWAATKDIYQTMRAWSNTADAGNIDEHCEPGVEALALAVFHSQSQGKAVLTVDSLRLFLTGIQVVMKWSKTNKRPVNPNWLDLESKTELQLWKYIPHMLSSPYSGKQ